MLSREPPTRTPRRTNLGQIVDNLLLNKMKNKSTFETKWTMFPERLQCVNLSNIYTSFYIAVHQRDLIFFQFFA